MSAAVLGTGAVSVKRGNKEKPPVIVELMSRVSYNGFRVNTRSTTCEGSRVRGFTL